MLKYALCVFSFLAANKGFAESPSPAQWVALGKRAVDGATQRHGTTRGFLVNSYSVGRLVDRGEAFDGAIVSYTVGRDVSHGLSLEGLPLTTEWVTTSGAPGDFTQQELLSASKLVFDLFQSDEDTRERAGDVLAYRVFLSESEYPLRVRIKMKTRELEYFCHKPGTRFACQRVN